MVGHRLRAHRRTMSQGNGRVRRVVAAVLSAAVVGVIGVGAIAPETAQAAGVVVDRQQAYGVAQAVPSRERDEQR